MSGFTSFLSLELGSVNEQEQREILILARLHRSRFRDPLALGNRDRGSRSSERARNLLGILGSYLGYGFGFGTSHWWCFE